MAIFVRNHTNYDVINKWLVPTNKLVFRNLINPPSFLSYWKSKVRRRGGELGGGGGATSAGEDLRHRTFVASKGTNKS